MLEVKISVTLTAPELANAINNLATAISGKNSRDQSASTGQAQPNTPMPAPVNPTPTPVASTPVQPAAPIANVPLAAAPQFTVDQIMAAGATLMDAGKVDDLLNLLHSFGVQAVMDLKPEQLGAFATEMRKLGAAI